MNTKRKKKVWRIVLLGLLIFVVLLVILSKCGYVNLFGMRRPESDYWGEEREHEAADTTLPDRTAQVLEKKALNEDTVGWLYVPDTGIDDVILHSEKGNDYYLWRDFDGNQNDRGSFFANMISQFGQGSRNDLDPLTTLFGHSFREDPDSGLFSGLKKYRDEDFAREHPYLYFSTWEENMAFEVIAVFEAHINMPYITYHLPPEMFEKMMGDIFDSSLYDYGAEVTPQDRLLVLSTCAMTVQGHDNLDPYNTDYRFVIMGKLVPPDEAIKTEAEFTVNPNPAPPDDFREVRY